MKVLVIIVTYNGEQWLDKCIGSVDRSKYDVMVVDNCSKDETVNCIKKFYPEVILREMSNNLGFGQANNIGLKYAINNKYDYVLLLNQDAWLLPDTIERLIAVQKLHPEYWILSPRQLSPTVTDYVFNEPTGEKDKPYDWTFIAAAIWLMPIEAIQTVGGFDPLFPHYGEDNDYIQRIEYHKHKICVVPELFAYHAGSNGEWTIEFHKYRMMLTYMCILKNINHSLTENVRSANAHIISSLGGGYRRLRVNFVGLIRAYMKLNKIIKSRKQSKFLAAFL